MQADFAALVKKADKARARGDVSGALVAYLDALELKDDPTVRGRVGLIEAANGLEERAIYNLFEAIEQGGGATDAEKHQFHEALRLARPRVCSLRIAGNVPDAILTIDTKQVSRYQSHFNIFIKPGPHVIRGRSETHGEALEEVDCPKGRAAEVSLNWHAQKSQANQPATPPEPTPAQESGRLEKTFAIIERRDSGRTSEARFDDGPRDGPARNSKASGARWSLGAGPALVLGAASWLPSFGATLSGGVRFGVASVNLDARGAWLTGSVGDKPIRSMTAGALLSGCGHWRWLFGCLTGHLGVIRVEAAAGRYDATAFTFFKPGLGVRVGGEFPLSDTLGVRLAVDAVGLSAATRVWVGRVAYADQPPILIGTTAAGVWHF